MATLNALGVMTPEEEKATRKWVMLHEAIVPVAMGLAALGLSIWLTYGGHNRGRSVFSAKRGAK